MSRNCWPSEVLTHPTRRKAAYELYAHVLVGEQRGLSDEKLATIVAGQRPIDLTREEQIAYDFASALVNGGVLPELTYKTAIAAFGPHGAAELSYLVGLYALVSITLNTFDVPVPEA
jgi:4-carboxymuconolactone decarboxylase